MRHSLLRLSVLALLLMVKMVVLGQGEFEVDGIKYVFTSEETVSVVSNNYSGDIIIPEHIVITERHTVSHPLVIELFIVAIIA